MRLIKPFILMAPLIYGSASFGVDVKTYPLPPDVRPSRQDYPGSHKESPMPAWFTDDKSKGDYLTINFRYDRPEATRENENSGVIFFNINAPAASKIKTDKKLLPFSFYENKEPPSVGALVSDSRIVLNLKTPSDKLGFISWQWLSDKFFAAMTSYTASFDSQNITPLPQLSKNISILESSFINKKTGREFYLLSDRPANNRIAAPVGRYDITTHMRVYLYEQGGRNASELIFPDTPTDYVMNEIIPIEKPYNNCISINYGSRGQFSYLPQNNIYEYCPGDKAPKKVASAAYRLSCSLSADNGIEVDIKEDSIDVIENGTKHYELQPSDIGDMQFFSPKSVLLRPWLNGENCQLANLERLDCLFSIARDSNNDITAIGCVRNDQLIDYIHEKKGLFLGTSVWLGPNHYVNGTLLIPILSSQDNESRFSVSILSLSPQEVDEVLKLAFVQ